MTPVDFISNLVAFWRGDAFDGSTLTDLSGNGNDLACTSVSAGTTATENGWGVTGVPIVTTVGIGGGGVSASGAPFKCLSDGTGSTFWAVVRASTASSSGVLFDTGVNFTSQVGARLRTLLASTVPADSKINVEFSNGLGDGYVIDYVNGNWWTWDGTFSFEVPHLIVYTLDTSQTPNIKIWVDGLLVGQLNTNDRVKEGPGRPLSSSDPSFAFHLFSAATGTFPWGGECEEAGVSASALTDTERLELQAYVAARCGITMTQSQTGVLAWDGNSLIDPFWRNDQFPPLTTKVIKRRQFNNMRAIAGLTIEQMILRAPTEVIPNYDHNVLYNILVAWEFVNSIAEGDTAEQAYDLYVQYCQLVRTGSHPFKLIVVPLLPERFATEADAAYINGRLLSEWPAFADGIARPDTDPILGSWPLMWEDYGGGSGPRIYRSDGVHFTALGNQMLVPYFQQAINDLLPGKPIVKRL